MVVGLVVTLGLATTVIMGHVIPERLDQLVPEAQCSEVSGSEVSGAEVSGAGVSGARAGNRQRAVAAIGAWAAAVGVLLGCLVLLVWRRPARGARGGGADRPDPRRVAEDLRQSSVSKAYLDKILDSMVDALVVLDARGLIRTVNPSCCELLGRAPEELIDESFFRFADLPEGDYLDFTTEIGGPSAEREIRETEFSVRDAEGQQIPVSANGSLMVGSASRGGAVVLVLRDMREPKRIQARLTELSRAAGMAEVATGVLHDVGNVLNSVNVAAALVHDHLAKMSLSAVSRVAELFEQHADDPAGFVRDDPRGAKLPELIVALAKRLEKERGAVFAELGHLTAAVDHVKAVVAAQQAYARPRSIDDEVSIGDVVDFALKLQEDRLLTGEIEIVRDFDSSLPRTVIDRSKVLQILTNLLANARDAMAGVEGRPRRLTVATRKLGGRIAISVADTGVGIAPEAQERLFQHGYTTKARGHGFGLHASALVAKELKASLTCDSAGAGQGATFSLVVPIRRARPSGLVTVARPASSSAVKRGCLTPESLPLLDEAEPRGD